MKLFLSIFTLYFTVTALPVMAQAQLPEFSISTVPQLQLDERQEAEFDYEQAFSNIKNPFMADILRLQYQVNLLERLIRRQTELGRIAQSYKKLGQVFDQPAPPIASCRILPVNVLCMAFYPELTKYDDLIGERRAKFEAEREAMLQNAIQEYNIEQTATPAPVIDTFTPPNDLYNWSDIRCLSNQCSALLENRNDETIRFRLRKGDELPEGGTVQKISMAGVTIRFKGNNYTLKPRNTDGDQQRDTSPRPRQLASAITNALGDEAPDMNNEAPGVENSAAIPPQTVDTDDNTAAIQTDGLLGATGLF